MTDKGIMQSDKLWLTDAQLLNGNEYLLEVTGDLELPILGQYGSTIRWESSPSY